MSKAFTRESDDVPDLPLPRASGALPPTAKNYLTPSGSVRLRNQLEGLLRERHELADKSGLNSQTGSLTQSEPDIKRRIQTLDQRIAHLQRALQTAVVTGPPSIADDVVRFGATVTVRDGSGEEVTYRIVGADETDLDRNWVSWLAPIATVLLGGRVGQRVRLKLANGEESLEILKVHYE
jgi:transcription elongation factor GreB